MLQDYLDNLYSYIFEDLTIKKITISLLIFYIIFGYRFLPSFIHTFMNNPIGRLILLLSVLYIFTKNSTIGLLALIAFWVSLNNHNDIQEHFNTCQGPDCPHSNDNDNDNDDDDDDDEKEEAFYVPEETTSQDLSDNFKQIHDTIHKLESMLKK